MVECSRCSSRPTTLCPRRSRCSYPSFQPGFKNCVEDFFILLLCCIPTLRGNSLLHIPFIVKTLQCNVIAHSWSPSWETYPPIWPMLFPTQILLEYLDQPLQSGLSTRESPSKSPSPYSMTPLLKGSFTIFLFLVRSYILNSNGVWYTWFCPEGPINASNSNSNTQRHRFPMALRVKVPCGAGSQGPWEQKKTKNFEFEAFIGPSGQNQLYHTPLLFKI